MPPGPAPIKGVCFDIRSGRLPAGSLQAAGIPESGSPVMLAWVEEIVQGAFTAGVNVPTFWFLNGCLVVLVGLCLVVALLASNGPSSAGIDLKFHFLVMAVLALGLGVSLNYVIHEAKVLKTKTHKGEKQS